MSSQFLFAILLAWAISRTSASTVCSPISGSSAQRIVCPSELPGTCRHVLTTLHIQLYLHQNNTYVMTDQPSKFCDPYQVPWPTSTYRVSSADEIGHVVGYQLCSAKAELKYGAFHFCPIFVSLQGECTYKSINKRQFELSTTSRIAAIDMHGVINHRTTLEGTQVFTIPPVTTGNNIIYINCGKHSWAMMIVDDPVDKCVTNHIPIYNYEIIARFRCNQPAWFFSFVVIITILAINKALIWTGLDIIIYPIYSAILAVLYQPIIYALRKMTGCKYCGKISHFYHKCQLVCCGVNHYTKDILLQHKIDSSCSDQDLIHNAKYISRSFIPKTLNLILCILVLVLILPVGSAHTCNGTAVLGGHSIPECQVAISNTTCNIVSIFYPNFTCSNLEFFGLVTGTNQIGHSRRRRHVILPHESFKTSVPRAKIDKRFAEKVGVQDAIITSSLLSGFIEVDLPGQLGESRMFKIQEEGMITPVTFTVSIADAKCTHRVTRSYTTCDVQIAARDLSESCTGDSSECYANITTGVPAVRKVWPQVQNWGCEEPGCLSVYTGCLGATCVANAKPDCADIIEVSEPTCSITVCVESYNLHECQTLNRDVEKGSIYATWTYQEPSRLLTTNKYAIYKNKLLTGPINSLGEFDYKFGSYQIVSDDTTYFLGEPVASYQCHAVAYKDVTFSKCVRNTFHLVQTLQPVTGLYLSESKKTLIEQDLLLGVVTARYKLKGVLINELESSSTISLGSANCKGHTGNIKGLNCTLGVTSDAVGIAHVTCTKLYISDGKVVLHTGHTLLTWFGFTDTSGHSTDNCTFKFSTRTLPFKVTLDATPLGALDLFTEPFFASQTIHGQGPCQTFICTVWTSLSDFFTGVFNTTSIVMGVMALILVALTVYIIIFVVVKAYYSFNTTYNAVSKEYLKTA
ncbi:membrane protein precursor [European shore crab virus 1]|uniref:Envelopment polyprotein n=1 Tax=European shore crab virus 1 TaxID=2847074 RepID=A0A5J6CW51_9VIRU|nr:membrane protein precursor [European shore crab virus 1]QEQ51086.1 membrane protein precursor [European shore crab virus 1]